jgi:hypothetical protein
VFEAAFVIDDAEDAGDTATPSSEGASAETKEKEAVASEDKMAKKNSTDSRGSSDAAQDAAEKVASEKATPELPAEVKTRLRKLEKLEKTYPGMWLRALTFAVDGANVTQNCCVRTGSRTAVRPRSNRLRRLSRRIRRSLRSRTPMPSSSI